MPESPQHKYSWVSLAGQFDEGDDAITFRGYEYTPPVPSGQDNVSIPPPQSGVGKATSNQRLTDGSVSVDVEFDSIDEISTAEILLHQDPVTDDMLTVGLGAYGFLFNLRYWTRSGDKRAATQQSGLEGENKPHWKMLRSAGNRATLRAKHPYHVEARVQGSSIVATLDGVELLNDSLPFQLSSKQIGIFCQNRWDIHFRHFRVESRRPLAFVVMQFDPPEYEELFNDVIVPVCDKMGLEPFRASQTYYPGLVIADIQRQIRESRVIIAEITPVNPNVYYEVGFADAIGKPVILIADGGKLEQLPFDVRAFRTLFYENSIGGKSKVEKTLTEFLRNIMDRDSRARS